jgi:TfoX/Sxy family transcriptional regulator of competence genes
MSYDEKLAHRLRSHLNQRPGFSERKMFGGICFMLHGNMCGGVLREDLIVRVKPEKFDRAMNQPHTRVFDFTGKPMRGFVVVTPKGYRSDKAFKNWVALGVECARARPRKIKKIRPRVK